MLAGVQKLIYITFAFGIWGCSSAGLEYLPVTQRVAGSSPVTPAILPKDSNNQASK